ncbi:MAG: DegT/DnrJ/EryC1/StrS family aminotransferase [Deltaproteobacteria bacterium]|nr:DegT/DnrJ/EryC1/StrS family aminotransferase [Deltaproteobacteria bacterium]
MDPALLEQALTDRIHRGTRPKAVIAVHLYGQPADMDAIIEICARHEVPLIEDAAESLGATLRAALQDTDIRVEPVMR